MSIVNFIVLLTKERVAAAGVCPDIGKGNFACGPLLQQELVVLIEEENAEGSMKYPFWLRLVESVDIILAGMAQNFI